MTKPLVLTHKDAFANLQIIEKFDKNETSKQVYGFGVSGKKFVLIKKKNSFFAKFWFNFCKFFRFIKVDKASIQKLRNAVTAHINNKEFKEWAKTKVKVTKLGIQTLMARNEQLEKGIDPEAAKRAEEEIKELENLLAEKDSRFELQDKALKMREDEGNAARQALGEQIQRAEQLQKELEETKVKYDSTKKRKNQYKKAWEHQNPDKKVDDYLKEHKFERRHSKVKKAEPPKE